MSNEKIVASVTLKSKSGLSMSKDREKFSLKTLDKFLPKKADIEQVAKDLSKAGFKIEAKTGAGISFSGSKELFESEFNVSIDKQKTKKVVPGLIKQPELHFKSSQPKMMSNKFADLAESIQLATPASPFHESNPPPINIPYYLNVRDDVPTLLNVASLHTNGITGQGVNISMVDTGFITQINENQTSINSNRVKVDHLALDVKGIWLASDTNHSGINYFINGNIDQNDKHFINLGTPLPEEFTNVAVVYSCLHPHYSNQNYTIGDIHAVAGLNKNIDEVGHGTAMAANALAVAPGATFSFVKYTDGSMTENYPLAAFQYAVANQEPDIITCSWGMRNMFPEDEADYDALFVEIAKAVADGIVVIFATGKNNTDDYNEILRSLAHPDLISVGGAYPKEEGGFTASDFASSYDSFIFSNPQRHCPDVVGLVGQQPQAVLILLPTQPNSKMDQDLAGQEFPNGDNTADDDGWCVCSGTSAAAPQIAGVVALLLEQYPTLTPNAIKNILENSARDINTGSSNSVGPDTAVVGWDAATGFGLIDGQAAVNFLQQNRYNAYIRDSILDNGVEPIVLDRIWASPDIIVRTEEVTDPERMLGLTVKHRHDLSDNAEEGQDNFIYLRVQNRGTEVKECTATVYFTWSGMFANPPEWKELGQISINDLNPGDFRVVGPITWIEGEIPEEGHYCLISILDSVDDPAPDLSTIHSSGDFTKMVRDKNNVAWKNINVVDVLPGAGSSFSFSFKGPQGDSHRADLRIHVLAFLPDMEPDLGLNVNLRMVKRLADTALLKHMEISEESTRYTKFHPLEISSGIENIHLESNEKSKVKIEYSVPEETLDGDYPIRASLYIDGDQTGGYTHVVRVNRHGFIGNRRTREVHRRKCSWVDNIRSYRRRYFGDLATAHRFGYDNCAKCLRGSKR